MQLGIKGIGVEVKREVGKVSGTGGRRALKSGEIGGRRVLTLAVLHGLLTPVYLTLAVLHGLLTPILNHRGRSGFRSIKSQFNNLPTSASCH